MSWRPCWYRFFSNLIPCPTLLEYLSLVHSSGIPSDDENGHSPSPRLFDLLVIQTLTDLDLFRIHSDVIGHGETNFFREVNVSNKTAPSSNVLGKVKTEKLHESYLCRVPNLRCPDDLIRHYVYRLVNLSSGILLTCSNI